MEGNILEGNLKQQKMKEFLEPNGNFGRLGDSLNPDSTDPETSVRGSNSTREDSLSHDHVNRSDRESLNNESRLSDEINCGEI